MNNTFLPEFFGPKISQQLISYSIHLSSVMNVKVSLFLIGFSNLSTTALWKTVIHLQLTWKMDIAFVIIY